MKSNIQSRHIVLTGVTAGIGHELVGQLYDGNRLTGIGRMSERLERVAQEFPDMAICEANLDKPAEVAAVAAKIASTEEPVDLLINNAAIQYTPRFTDDAFRIETIEEEINTNLVAPAILAAGLLPALRRSSSPVIVNVNSALGLVPKTSSAVYCASKGGLNILSRSLAYQFEPMGIDVVQAFMPLVDTGMTTGRGDGKISPAEAATAMLRGLGSGGREIYIGKAKLLRWILRFAPGLASSIMKRA